MTKDFEELVRDDKLQYSLDELTTIKRLLNIKKNQNSPGTNFLLLFSFIAIGAGIINLFYPILYTLSTQVLIYLSTIPAFMNIAIKLRELSIKNAFKKEFGLSNKELQAFLKSDQMEEFEEMISAIERGEKELDFIQLDNSVFNEFPDIAPGVQLETAEELSQENSILSRILNNQSKSNKKLELSAKSDKPLIKSKVAKNSSKKVTPNKSKRVGSTKHNNTAVEEQQSDTDNQITF